VANERRLFKDWADDWMLLASHRGTTLPDPERRINEILSLWEQPIPGVWAREEDERLLDIHRRYLRNDAQGSPVPGGEHEIEMQILDPLPGVTQTQVLGDRMVDGVNALPLAKDAKGGRAGNVEADMLLLLSGRGGYRHALIEVKSQSDHPWYAAVELLRQLRLFMESAVAQELFARRRPEIGLAPHVPTTAAVLAPAAFYRSPGRNATGVQPATELLEQMRQHVGVDARLTTWHAETRVVSELE
jgi:hypothetical protein